MTRVAAAPAALPSHNDRRSGVLVDVADIPGGGQLRLIRHGRDHEILFGDEQLMGSWACRSEQALATLVFERLGVRACRTLIGGLGMGFTLNAARSALPHGAAILVAELVPGVLAWARGPLASIMDGALHDPRVTVELRDVHDVIARERDGFDAILLDVDNGPDGLIDLSNERLYCAWGLRSARAALRPGGILAVWSAFPDRSFADRLRDADFAVEEVSVMASATGPLHTIWLAARAD